MLWNFIFFLKYISTHTHTHAHVHPVKGYPVIDGVLRLTNITFARFSALSNPCPYGIYAITNNPLSPDAVHPIVMTGTSRLNCDENSLVHFHDPDPDWINQEVHLAGYYT